MAGRRHWGEDFLMEHTDIDIDEVDNVPTNHRNFVPCVTR